LNKYFVSLNPELEKTAWYKATIDVEYLLTTMNYNPIFVQDLKNNIDKSLSNITNEKSVIFLQYPRSYYEGLDLFNFTNYIKKNYSYLKTILLVHDLDSIRYDDFFITNSLREVEEINLFDYIITVNEAMTSLLKKQGVISEIYTLNIFDYIISTKKSLNKNINTKKITIAYTGNLKHFKSSFIYNLNSIDWGNIEINLYGTGFIKEKIDTSKGQIKYIGEYHPNDLPNIIDADYGLCWDGNSISMCDGKIGKYLQYTNPHKTSFYLSIGIPVIISKDISTATYIKRENVGILIDSLYELPKTLNNISYNDYAKFKDNAVKLSSKLREGYYLKKVLTSIEDSICMEDYNE
jgi:hypothetical protein